MGENKKKKKCVKEKVPFLFKSFVSLNNTNITKKKIAPSPPVIYLNKFFKSHRLDGLRETELPVVLLPLLLDEP